MNINIIIYYYSGCENRSGGTSNEEDLYTNVFTEIFNILWNNINIF